jgi:hypothetical protein
VELGFFALLTDTQLLPDGRGWRVIEHSGFIGANEVFLRKFGVTAWEG